MSPGRCNKFLKPLTIFIPHPSHNWYKPWVLEDLINSSNPWRFSSPIQTTTSKTTIDHATYWAQAPPGGLRSGAPAPWSQGVWGLAPILRLPSFMPFQSTTMYVQLCYVQLKVRWIGLVFNCGCSVASCSVTELLNCNLLNPLLVELFCWIDHVQLEADQLTWKVQMIGC